MKWLLVAGALALTLTFPPATAIQVPGALRVGNRSLPAASCATRDTLWIHHYAAALYLPPEASPASALQDPQGAESAAHPDPQPHLPAERPAGEVARTLEAHLDLPSFTSVRLAWREIAVGDQVTIAYLPGTASPCS